MTRTRFYMVELYKETGELDKARAIGQKALAEAGCAEHAWECSYYKEQVKKLLAELPAQ